MSHHQVRCEIFLFFHKIYVVCNFKTNYMLRLYSNNNDKNVNEKRKNCLKKILCMFAKTKCVVEYSPKTYIFLGAKKLKSKLKKRKIWAEGYAQFVNVIKKLKMRLQERKMVAEGHVYFLN